MEKLSRSRQPNRPIHSIPKNPCNVVAAGFGSSKATTYDDVFGGPPRFGAPSLSPRLEDYCEIFGGVHLPSRGAASSIPVLDLPVIDGGDELFDVSSPGLDYQEVFGGFQPVDFAPSYDELLMEQSEGGDDDSDSCDEAWTPGETGSISGGTDDSGKSPCFSNGRDSYESINVATDFSISYNRAGDRGDYNTVNAIPHVASVPGYTSSADETAYAEAMEGKQLKKTLSYPAHSDTKGHSSENDLKAHKTYNRFQSCPRETFVSVTDISLKTLPSGLPPPSRAPPLFRRDSNSSASNCRTTCSEGSVGGSSSSLFDLETDASTAAVKDAMEKAQAKLKSAKELLERKRDGSRTHVKASSVNGRMAEERKSSGNESAGKESISSQGSDKLDANDEWAEASQFFELVTTEKLRNAVEDDKLHNDMIFHVVSQNENLSMEEIFEKQHESKVKGFIEINDAEFFLKRPEVTPEAQIQRRNEKKVRVGKHILHKGIDEKSIKVVQHDEKEDEIHVGLEKHENQVISEHEENETLAQLATKPKKRELHQKQTDKDVKDQKQSKICLPRGAGRKKEKDLFDWEENARKLREALAMDENEKTLEATLELDVDGKKQKTRIQIEENEKKLTEASEQGENERMRALDAEPMDDLIRLKEDHEKEQNDLRLKEDLAKAEKRMNDYLEQEEERRLKEAQEKEQNELRMEEAREKEQNKLRMKEAREKEQNELRMKEAREKEQNELRMREAREREENELRMREAREREENELRMREALEQAENMRKMKEALEQEAFEREEKERQLTEIRKKEKKDRKLKEALENKEKERRLKEVIEKESMERRRSEVLEQENREKSQTEAREREEIKEKFTEAAFKREENKIRLNETLKKEEKEKKQKEACEREESECHGDGEKTMEMDLKDGLQEGRHRREERTRMGINCKEARVLKQEENRDVPDLKLGKREGLERLDEEVETSQSDEEERLPKEDRDHLLTKDGLVGASDDTSCNRVKGRFERAVEAGVFYGERSTEEDKDVFETSFSISEDRRKYACEKENISNSNIEHGKATVNHEEANESFLPHRAGKDMGETRREDAIKTAVPDIANWSTMRRSQEKDAERAKEERELENERLRKIEEEKEREREREKDRMAMGQRALAEARERLEKACSEARDKSLGEKLFMEARLRGEKAAVERATTEAPERAAGRPASEAKERMERSVSDKWFQSSNSFGAPRYQNYSSAYVGGVNGESVQRRMSRLERHRRTAERVAKALAEKNMRDLLVQREQAERNRLAETLDADVKRWSGGKEGNVRALLSTLQYILGPESGWQPIHLTEVITSAAVKRAYRKATLCVHPDKLQQRGASIQQKYISEKVFDLLKDAWNRFNSEER